MTRRDIIKALEEKFNVKARYMGVPSFSYRIFTERGIYIIDKEARIYSLEGEEIKLDVLISEIDDSKEVINWNELNVDFDGHTGITLRNILNMINSKQSLIKKAFDLEEDIINSDFIVELNKREINTINDLAKAFEDIPEQKPNGISFDFKNKRMKFAFCKASYNAKLAAYVTMIVMLCKYAKKLKSASYKPTITDNEKFTMRTWLIRLGFIGPDFKEARKELIKSLSGNSAFRFFNLIENNNELPKGESPDD